MTENFVWFAVASDKTLEDNDELYNIESIPEPQLVGARGRDWTPSSDLKWYKGTTYFKQKEAVNRLISQYGDALWFIGYTTLDTYDPPEEKKDRRLNDID